MAQETTWLVPGRIIQVRSYGVATPDDLREENVQVQALLRDGVAPVHLIINMLDVEEMKLGIRDIRETLLNQDNSNAAMVGWTLIVRNNSLMQFFASMAVQMLKLRFAFVDSMDDAQHFLTKSDLTLNGLV